MENKKKPVYKRWWFWVIIVLFLLGLIGSSNEQNNTNNVNVDSKSEANIVIEEKETEEEKQERLERERIEKEQKEAEEKQRKLEEETQFKADAKTFTYEELARNPDKIKGEKVKLTGEVIQAMQGNMSVDLRINITKTGTYTTYYTDTIYGIYIPETGEDKILEDDIVTIWGIAQGDYTYTSTLGQQVTLPLISIKYVEINK